LTRFPEPLLDAIRQAVDLVDLVGRYVPLKKAGRSFSACCPFHREKTPSFHVWSDTQTWKCFGCGKGGSGPFSFLMEKEGLRFPEAVRQLAQEVGVDLEPEDPAAARQASRRSRLRQVTEWACRHFEGCLRAPEGAAVRDYLKGRGITGETALNFRVGYAPPGWERLRGAGKAAGYDDALLEEAGLVIRRDPDRGRGDGVYDRFRDRVVFPIADAQGRVIAFGARTLDGSEPKYLNSPETPLYSKGRHLYALHLAKDEMLRSGEGAIVEGYTDVLMAHQQGWPAVVAGLGTALTREQAALLSRYVRRLWLVYDGDEAGRRAARRAVPEFLPESIETRVALLPAGKDPFDLLRDGGRAAFVELLEQSDEAFDHLIAAQRAAPDAGSVAGRTRILEELAEVLVRVTNRAARELYVRRVSEELMLSEPVVLEAVAGVRGRQAHRARSRAEASMDSPAGEEGSPDPGATAEQRPAPPLERELVMALLGCPALLDPFREELGADTLSHPGCRAIIERMLDAAESGPVDMGALLAHLEDPILAAFGADLVLEGHGRELEQQGLDCIARLVRHREQFALLESLNETHDSDEEAALLRRLQGLHKRRSSDLGRGVS